AVSTSFNVRTGSLFAKYAGSAAGLIQPPISPAAPPAWVVPGLQPKSWRMVSGLAERLLEPSQPGSWSKFSLRCSARTADQLIAASNATPRQTGAFIISSQPLAGLSANSRIRSLPGWRDSPSDQDIFP